MTREQEALERAFGQYAQSSEGAGSVQAPVVQRLVEAVFDLLAARPDEPPAWLSVDRLAAAMNDAQVQASEIRLGHDLRIPAARILSRLRTPDAPADGGGSLDAERLARAMHVALGKHTDHTGPVCPACREDATDAAREYLRLTPSVPTDREPT